MSGADPYARRSVVRATSGIVVCRRIVGGIWIGWVGRRSWVVIGVASIIIDCTGDNVHYDCAGICTSSLSRAR